jgi:hypothetical protein
MKRVLILFVMLFSIGFAVTASVPTITPEVIPNHLTLYGEILDHNEVTIFVYQKDPRTEEYEEVHKLTTNVFYELNLDPTEDYMIWFKNYYSGYCAIIKVDIGRSITALRSFDLNTSTNTRIEFYEISAVTGSIQPSTQAFEEPSDIQLGVGILDED